MLVVSLFIMRCTALGAGGDWENRCLCTFYRGLKHTGVSECVLAGGLGFTPCGKSGSCLSALGFGRHVMWFQWEPKERANIFKQKVHRLSNERSRHWRSLSKSLFRVLLFRGGKCWCYSSLWIKCPSNELRTLNWNGKPRGTPESCLS